MRSRLPLGVLFGVVLSVTTPAEADRWYVHYARAEAALLTEDWQTAVTELNQALERKGDSGVRVRTYGMRATPYFPYLKLGIAFFHSGQFDAALRAFETEERLGAVKESEDALGELERFRRLATEAMQQRQVQQRQQIAEIVRDSLAEAEAMQGQGRLYEALAATGRALSVAPEHPEASRLVESLRAEISDREEGLARSARVTTLIDQGIRLRAGGELSESAASFRQAVEIAPESDARDLLAQVQAELAAQVAQSSRLHRDEVLRRVREKMRAGDFSRALTLVQELLGAEPHSTEVLALEGEILAWFTDRARRRELERLLEEAQFFVAGGDHERAIATANVVLARDQGNPAALRLLGISYREVSRRLLALDHPIYRFQPVYIDLQGTPEEDFFFVLGDAILQAVTGQGLTPSARRDGYTSRELVNDIRRVLKTMKRSGGKPAKLVLFLDEIDELNEYSHRTNQRLRSLFMRSFADQLVAVAAGVGIQRRWDHQGSPWYNFFEELEVGPLDAAAARDLITRPLAGMIQIDQEAVDRLFDSTGGRPYLLQKTALRLVQRAHELGRRRITVADVDALLDSGNPGPRRPETA